MVDGRSGSELYRARDSEVKRAASKGGIPTFNPAESCTVKAAISMLWSFTRASKWYPRASRNPERW